MTDLIVHQRSGSYSFDQDMMEASNEVSRLNPNISNNRSDDFEDNPDSTATENPQAGVDRDLFKYVTLKSRNGPVGSIMLEQELRLMLLRHWNLYDSLCNSNYLVSKLQLWKEHG